jgi:hypothetical protein
MAKQAKSTPDIYVGLTSNPDNLRRCLVEDTNLVLSLFDSRAQLEGLESYEALIRPTIGFVWNNFSDFDKQVNEQTALTRHEQLFGGNPPKKQDLIETKLKVWHKMCNSVKNSLVSTGTPTDPVSQRKSTILTCKYYVGSVNTGTGDIKTYQALQCLKLFRSCIDTQGTEEEIADGAGGMVKVKFVSEATLKQYVIDHAGDLKTRQEPWRIFQYYRPTLIAAKLLRRQ